ncbi:NlpC/P60 family protein [Lichenibacterium ramalinae]|uniref:Peptidase P60 n=1 Tax=Lichenibacterium ramalinae TaxID=2316527 RepID=A0A4Q2RDD8_9HYPH|nr:NlpC/P60 family protein [Lichenibacterium ramalinae]RYB03952.1 peptidase P60 [Lichenibacterium ramalinae]
MSTRDDVVASARRFIGTPYHHQAALAGAGCDCLGLVRGVWRDLYGAEPEVPPPYTPDWGEVGEAEPMLEAARRHLVPVDLAAAGPGDVVLFRLRPGCPAKHAAILSDGGRMIHAQSRDRVREVAVGTWWWRRAVAGFGWPER